MKKPEWLEKEKLYSIMFESDTPLGRIFDMVLIVAISLSILISFVETIPELARTFKLTLEVLETPRSVRAIISVPSVAPNCRSLRSPGGLHPSCTPRR